MCCCAVLMFDDRSDVVSITKAEGNSETTAAGVMLFNNGYTATIMDYSRMRNKTLQQQYIFTNHYPQISDSSQDNMKQISSTQISSTQQVHCAVLPWTSAANHSPCHFSFGFEVRMKLHSQVLIYLCGYISISLLYNHLLC